MKRLSAGAPNRAPASRPKSNRRCGPDRIGSTGKQGRSPVPVGELRLGEPVAVEVEVAGRAVDVGAGPPRCSPRTTVAASGAVGSTEAAVEALGRRGESQIIGLEPAWPRGRRCPRPGRDAAGSDSAPAQAVDRRRVTEHPAPVRKRGANVPHGAYRRARWTASSDSNLSAAGQRSRRLSSLLHLETRIVFSPPADPGTGDSRR